MGTIQQWKVFVVILAFNVKENAGQSRSQVLGGNYGQFGFESIPNFRQIRQAKLENKNEDSDSLKSKGRASVTFEDLQKKYKENYKKVIGMAMNFSKAGESSEFTAKVKSCAETLPTCQAIPVYGTKCYIDCLAKGNANLEPLLNVIKEALDLLCKPLKTVYIKMFDVGEDKSFPQFRTYPKFLEVLDASPYEFSTIVPQLANAMNVALIKHMLTNLMPLRVPVMEIEKELDIQYPGSGFLTQNNPGCITLDMWDSIEKLIDMFYKDPSTIDIVMPGFAFITMVRKYTESRPTHRMGVLMETFRMFSGSAGGFGCNEGLTKRDEIENRDGSGESDIVRRRNRGGRDNFSSRNSVSSSGSETNSEKKGNCDELGKNPVSGFPIPPPLGGSDFATLLTPQCESNQDPNSPVMKKGKAKMNENDKDDDKGDKEDESKTAEKEEKKDDAGARKRRKSKP